jgi:hypothetical protein
MPINCFKIINLIPFIANTKNSSIVRGGPATRKWLAIIVIIEFKVNEKISYHFPICPEFAIISNTSLLGKAEIKIMVVGNGNFGFMEFKIIEVKGSRNFGRKI